MSTYQEFTGKSVEEAIRAACEAFGVGLGELDFEILTPGSRGVLGMGAEPARIVAAPVGALGGTAPKRAAAEATPLPSPPSREDRGPRDAGFRDDRGRDRGRREERYRAGRDRREAGARPPGHGDRDGRAPRDERTALAQDRGRDRGRRETRAGAGHGHPGGSPLSEAEVAQVTSARGSLAMERAELQAADATPEALQTGREILEALMGHLGFDDVAVEVREGETSRLNVVGAGRDHEGLGSLIGRKGERLSALQHLVNLMLSRRTGQWTRVLVDVEDYRGRRERQLAELAQRAAERVVETGKMLQLEPMPALERRWIHLALRDHEKVATQSIGEEPNRRVVLVPRSL